MSVLDIYAGKKAFKRIQQQGFSADLFDYILGASGGPKWFILAGLDRFIFAEFFANRHKPIQAIGSSAGAFRMACFAQDDPLAAINRLADRYSHTVYSDRPNSKEITEKGNALLEFVLGDDGAQQILKNKIVKAHFVVAKCKGLTKFSSKSLQMTGLAMSAGANFFNRKYLSHFYQRYIFSSPNSHLEINDPYQMGCTTVSLKQNNLKDALMASGSIPIIINGVKNIAGASKGVYRDGGLIDYHFDLSFGPSDGLILYPHFYSKVIPGWFDKSLKNRLAHSSSYDNVVMLVPSDEFIYNLPFHKIPDRKDFETMPSTQRISYWQEVIGKSNQLADVFQIMCQNNDFLHSIKHL
ncbi:patatin-like phospholipase family protein [Paraglaciecola sp. L3A3]|uniref:patatin-like phospholipase family protein n=1 Tax=Paraglaciecola sp. L3A3 TaxID=2686358 RepID=UPI00131C2F5B|nr:patatin-like phospholipase family protein [Paraglaciecola sp. L3A3]